MNPSPSYNDLKELVENISEELHAQKNEVDRLKSSFLANISHEIRTPMNVIVGFSSLLADPAYNEKQKKFFIKEINKNSQELLRLIDQIILTSKIQTKSIRVNKAEHYIDDLLEGLYHYYRKYLKNFEIERTKLNYIENKQAEKKTVIYTDEEKLKEALKCLMDNAVRFTQRGTISFGYELHDRTIVLFIKDTGIGIHSKPHKRIIEDFYNIDAVGKNFGLGIGLSVADSLARLLGGKLELDSSHGKGTSFYLSIPQLIQKSVI